MMTTSLLTHTVSVLATLPMLLMAQSVRDSVPLRHWPAPLYWQPDIADLHPLAGTPAQPTPLTFIGMTPCRVVDTRAGSGFTGAFGPPSLVPPTTNTRTFPMQSSSTCSIPSTALAYSLNITVVPPGLLRFVSVWPTGQSQPNVSTLNDILGTIVANAAIVPTGTSGSINVFASNATDLVIDINGYYAASFGTPAGGYAFPDAGGTPLMTITPSGNVGIGAGETTPASTLDVAGDINLNGILRWQANPVLRVSPSPNGSIGLGLDALPTSTGVGNTVVGTGALNYNTSGFNNTAVGNNALSESSTGSNNTGIGVNALISNFGGNNNTGVGVGALLDAFGSNNIAIGLDAGLNVTGNSNNILIGSEGTAADTGTIRIGRPFSVACGITPCGPQTSFFAAGIRGVTTANNDAIPVLIDSAGQLGTVNSSRRYKEHIQDMGDTSSGLMRLRPVTFRYQKPFADGSKPIQYGLIAEEVEEVYPDLVAHSADGQVETVKYQVLDSMLLNEVQRQQRRIADEADHISRLENQNRLLENRLARLEEAMEKAASTPK